MTALYLIFLMYLIFMSAFTTNTLPKLIMLSAAVVGCVGVATNYTFYTYPIWITMIYSFLFIFSKALTIKSIPYVRVIRTISLIFFILTIVFISKI